MCQTVSLDTVDDSSFLKGHEFLDDDSAYKILFQNVQFSLTGIPLSAEFCGWLIASAMGKVTSAQVGFDWRLCTYSEKF